MLETLTVTGGLDPRGVWDPEDPPDEGGDGTLMEGVGMEVDSAVDELERVVGEDSTRPGRTDTIPAPGTQDADADMASLWATVNFEASDCETRTFHVCEDDSSWLTRSMRDTGLSFGVKPLCRGYNDN